MRRRAYGVGTLFLLSLVLEVAPAVACKLEPLRLHELNPALEQSDTVAPAAPVIVAAEVTRRSGLSCGEERCIENSCGDMGAISIEIAPGSDDQTPAEQLGYRLEIVSGLLPESVRSRLVGTLAARKPLLLNGLSFDDVGLLDVTVRAVAVDAAGNASAPSAPFVLAFDGCTLAPVGDECEDEFNPDELSLSPSADEAADGSGTFEIGAPAAACTLPPGGRSGAAWPGALALLGAIAALRVHGRRKPS